MHPFLDLDARLFIIVSHELKVFCEEALGDSQVVNGVS